MAVSINPTAASFQYTVTRVADSTIVGTFSLAPGEEYSFTSLEPGDYDITQIWEPVDDAGELGPHYVFSETVEPESVEVLTTIDGDSTTIRVTVPDYVSTSIDVTTNFVNVREEEIIS